MQKETTVEPSTPPTAAFTKKTLKAYYSAEWSESIPRTRTVEFQGVPPSPWHAHHHTTHTRSPVKQPLALRPCTAPHTGSLSAGVDGSTFCSKCVSQSTAPTWLVCSTPHTAHMQSMHILAKSLKLCTLGCATRATFQVHHVPEHLCMPHCGYSITPSYLGQHLISHVTKTMTCCDHIVKPLALGQPSV